MTCLREGYGLESFRHDLIAGLTVAVVALPLAMALAIASGTTPERGLFTAVIAGFLISALGGSRLQIGGPTGAFVVVVFATIERHGYDGLLLATLLAGIMLVPSSSHRKRCSWKMNLLNTPIGRWRLVKPSCWRAHTGSSRASGSVFGTPSRNHCCANA